MHGWEFPADTSAFPSPCVQKRVLRAWPAVGTMAGKQLPGNFNISAPFPTSCGLWRNCAPAAPQDGVQFFGSLCTAHTAMGFSFQNNLGRKNIVDLTPVKSDHVVCNKHIPLQLELKNTSSSKRSLWHADVWEMSSSLPLNPEKKNRTSKQVEIG